jgi:CNT family concentrative nucleoside transporter
MKLNDVLLVLERATQAGTSLVFGYLGGGPAPFQVLGREFQLRARVPRAADRAGDQRAVGAALLLARDSGAVRGAVVRAGEGDARGRVVGLRPRPTCSSAWWTGAALVRPYLARLSRGELFAIMAGGMASIAGTVLFLYGEHLGR